MTVTQKEFVESVVLEHNEKHFELNYTKGLLKYRNVISSTRGGERFPDGFFDEKEYIMTQKECHECRKLIDDFIKNATWKHELELLPPGASRDEYCRMVYSSGMTLYYTNTLISCSGYGVETLPSEPTFIKLFKYLNRLCKVLKFTKEVDTQKVVNVTYDQRYFNETLWMCPNCKTFNLYEHKNCIKCGTPNM